MKTAKNIFSEYNVFCGALNDITFNNKTVISTINQYSFCIAEQDPHFKKALKSSDILLPDGVGIVIAIRSTLGSTISKISGNDLHQFLLSKLNKISGNAFYLGSSEGTLNKITERLNREHPNIITHSFSPVFKPDFTKEESAEMIHRINENNPDVLFVGMTAPKQEKWIEDNKNEINAQIICSIGAVFDFYAGTVKRPKKCGLTLGLSGLYGFVRSQTGCGNDICFTDRFYLQNG